MFKAAMDGARLATSERMSYTVPDACDVLGISRTSLYQLIRSGELKIVKIAGRTLVPRSELERLTHVDR
jgi:excisionase family DNA binding protein